ncbi:MAG: hypothetical protein ACFFBP_19035 [Promethearchaeota archaeon]
MSNEIKTEISLRSSDVKKELKCEFRDNQLQECIDIENFQQFSLDSSEITNRAILKCLNTMLGTCIGKNKIDINFSLINMDIVLKKQSNNTWIIDNINLNLDPHFDDEIYLDQLKKCLKFFDITCIKPKSINFTISFSETNEALKHYRNELYKLKNELEDILGKELNI